ncbi:hypothetical protein Csa_023547, partial [Cucumis sativus]
HMVGIVALSCEANGVFMDSDLGPYSGLHISSPRRGSWPSLRFGRSEQLNPWPHIREREREK